MLRPPARQTGITMLEVLVALSASALLTLAVVQRGVATLRQGTFDSAVTAAQSIAKAVEANQSRVTATAIDPATGVYSYTFGGRTADFTDVTALNAQMGRNFPEVTPYDTDYEFRGNGAISEVRFLIDNALLNRVTPSGATIVPDGAAQSYVVVTALRLPTQKVKRRAQWAKREIYQETTR